tara:strand:+ start:989 stop:1861 length:873 start_codon:yes stop_codon:yes gene_type:complete
MKKTIIAFLVSLMTFGIANAKTIDYLVTGTPGGTAYDNAELFVPILEKETGFKFNKVIVDSAVGATIYLKKSKNPSVWIQNTLDHESVGNELQATPESWIGTGWGRAMAFCSNEALDEAVARLKAGKRLTFAVSNSYGQHLIDPLVDVTGTPMKFVPYGSSGKSLKGFVAGDTDMLFTNMPKAVSGVTKNGISCWANTGPTKILDMEPMATLFPEYKYNDIQTFTYLDSANMSESDVATLRAAWQNVLKNEAVAGHIKNKKLFHPSVYGDLTPTEWAAKLDKAGKNWVGK